MVIWEEMTLTPAETYSKLVLFSLLLLMTSSRQPVFSFASSTEVTHLDLKSSVLGSGWGMGKVSMPILDWLSGGHLFMCGPMTAGMALPPDDAMTVEKILASACCPLKGRACG